MHTRSYAVDVFRGIALLFIVVNHIAGSVLAWGTSRNFAISDATEQFVFLAGLVTALAYAAITHRKGVAVADQRFRRRAWEIYRAFLITAALMFACGGVLMAVGLATPAYHGSEVKAFVAAPGRTIFEVLTLQRQPFFSDILPMYAFFALLTPLWMRLAQRSWPTLLLVSLALWAIAPWLGVWLPSVNGGWTFNPFAWQLVFTLGLIVGVHTGLPDKPSARFRPVLVAFAVAVTLAGAVFSLFSYHAWLRELFLPFWFEEGIRTFSKSNASLVRILNFLAMAWLVYLATRRGWLDRVLSRLTWVATVGRHGLVCFVGGTVISIVAETVAHLVGGEPPHWAAALTADVLAVALLLTLAAIADAIRVRRRGAAAKYDTGRWPTASVTGRA